MSNTIASLNSDYFKRFEEIVVIDNNIKNLLLAEKILSKAGKPFYLFLLAGEDYFNYHDTPEVISLDNINDVADYFWNTTPKRLFVYGPAVNRNTSSLVN